MKSVRLTRATKETEITVEILPQETGTAKISTGIGFFDHMLQALSTHSGINMNISAKGDLFVDGHHTVEDTGIVLGQALAEALGDKNGIARFGSAYIPMDEALGFCALDLSNRPFLRFDGEFQNQLIGTYDTCLTEEFFRAVAVNAGMTLHLRICCGTNDHHKCEALFKAFAHALRIATSPVAPGTVLSTKGAI